MKKVIVAMMVLGLLPITSSPAQATKCKDGTYSSSTGRGTCSKHGGIATSSDKINKQIKAKLLKEYGIVISDPRYSNDNIQLGAALALLEKQKAMDAAKLKANK